MTVQKNAYVDVNRVIVTSDDGKIVRAKRIKGIVGGGRWHLPRGRWQFKETFEIALKSSLCKNQSASRAFLSFLKVNLSNGATTSGFEAVVPIPSPIRAVVGPVTNPPSAKPIILPIFPIMFFDEKAAFPTPPKLAGIIALIKVITAN